MAGPHHTLGKHLSLYEFFVFLCIWRDKDQIHFNKFENRDALRRAVAVSAVLLPPPTQPTHARRELFDPRKCFVSGRSARQRGSAATAINRPGQWRPRGTPVVPRGGGGPAGRAGAQDFEADFEADLDACSRDQCGNCLQATEVISWECPNSESAVPRPIKKKIVQDGKGGKNDTN